LQVRIEARVESIEALRQPLYGDRFEPGKSIEGDLGGVPGDYTSSGETTSREPADAIKAPTSKTHSDRGTPGERSLEKNISDSARLLVSLPTPEFVKVDL